MCQVPRGILVCVGVLLLLALAAVAVAGGIDYWYYDKLSLGDIKIAERRVGLWRYCASGAEHEGCFTRKNILKFERGFLKFEPDLDIALIGLSVSALIIVIAFILCIVLACSRNPSKYSTVWLSVLALLGGLCCLFPAVWLMLRVKENLRPSWCFYIDYGGCGLCVVASLLSVLVACCCRNAYFATRRDDEIVMLAR